ncbi:MAG: DsrH/TusB family sulfur metabolism protein [Pseudoalteromonas sp.]|uniref:DsrH/TusB family sulfur metabolism protein n=1 Tax=unclassified Pseudoalteromonas TaxID=194690 RepID=UPI000C06D19E|nr:MULTISPECIES: DsrH/TusB family sulfur metabolism protein [unclassified Pseudoalteromonas]MDP2635756.1 DsrH/TusB family sulfur metabolism protein [Pseudoalteromonas sp. 1_MG-2023]PHN91296.1 tRNA 2-thiouridine-synthesizing protein [Pseudoalteromonas sp. 3D05]TGE85989.1 tRNA 2-thiouridine-synthesizing protein [Pseudoalteromonas sp. KS88]
MSTLHIFSKPISYYDNERLVNLIQQNDTVLLVGDACYSQKLYFQLCDKLLLLSDDAKARNIEIMQQNTAIDYEIFVAKTLSSSQSITW